MRKLTCILLLYVFLCGGSARADLYNNNYRFYDVVGHKKTDVARFVADNLLNKGYKIYNINNNSTIIYYQNQDKTKSYYIRFYPNNNNTNVIVVSNSFKNIENNDLKNALSELNLQYSSLKNRAAEREYKNDFVEYVRAYPSEIQGFSVLPDKIGWAKKFTKKLDEKIFSKNKKVSIMPYTGDTGKINLDCVDTNVYYGKGFKVIKNEYRLKYKENKYVHAYEYLIKNDNISDLFIESVNCSKIVNLKDITERVYIDLDRIDALDNLGEVLAVPTLGTSMLLSIPNWVRFCNAEKETARYTHAFPQSLKVGASGDARILTLQYKEEPAPLKFVILKNSANYNFEF